MRSNLSLNQAGRKWRVAEVAPVSWTPDYLGSRSTRWARQEQPTRLSSAARWLSWCAPEELARGFEATAQSIRNWLAQSERNAGRGDGGLTTAEREELNRLRRENRQLRLEREILSKAAAWFARATNTIPRKGSSS